MSRPVPLDPMYERFRERHPDVTLVLLPADDAADAEGAGPVSPSDLEEAEHDLEQARDDVGSLLTDVCAVLEIEGRIEVDWRSGERTGAVHAVATTHAPLAITADEALHRLRSFAWEGRFTSRAPVPYIDARRGEFALRLVVHEGRARITLRGDDVVVGPRRSAALVGKDVIARG